MNVRNQSRNTRPAARYRPSLKPTLLIGMTLAGGLYTFTRDTIPQDTHYHAFADGRALAGVENFANVISNLSFLIIGGFGIALVLKNIFFQSPKAESALLAYFMFFVGLALTGLGSMYYHIDPSNSSLIWDRTPMTISFMAFLTIIIEERIHKRVGRMLLFPLVIAGLSSAGYWHLSEIQGNGDLRFYLFIQFFPMILIPIIMALYPKKYILAKDIMLIFSLYLLAKACEVADRQIFAAIGLVSGHTAKHLIAAMAGLWVVGMLRNRQRYVNASPQPEAVGSGTREVGV